MIMDYIRRVYAWCHLFDCDWGGHIVESHLVNGLGEDAGTLWHCRKCNARLPKWLDNSTARKG